MLNLFCGHNKQINDCLICAIQGLRDDIDSFKLSLLDRAKLEHLQWENKMLKMTLPEEEDEG